MWTLVVVGVSVAAVVVVVAWFVTANRYPEMTAGHSDTHPDSLSERFYGKHVSGPAGPDAESQSAVDAGNSWDPQPPAFHPSRKGKSVVMRCSHLESISDVAPSSPGCEDCLAAGRRDWVHLRVCQSCGHVGCCDSSPGRHTTRHFEVSDHPVVRSYEPGEGWFWCYVDEVMFALPDAAPAPVHP